MVNNKMSCREGMRTQPQSWTPSWALFTWGTTFSLQKLPSWLYFHGHGEKKNFWIPAALRLDPTCGLQPPSFLFVFFWCRYWQVGQREKPQYYTSSCSNFSSLLLKWCCGCCKLETELIMNKVNRSQDPILPGITLTMTLLRYWGTTYKRKSYIFTSTVGTISTLLLCENVFVSGGELLWRTSDLSSKWGSEELFPGQLNSCPTASDPFAFVLKGKQLLTLSNFSVTPPL